MKKIIAYLLILSLSANSLLAQNIEEDPDLNAAFAAFQEDITTNKNIIQESHEVNDALQSIEISPKILQDKTSEIDIKELNPDATREAIKQLSQIKIDGPISPIRAEFQFDGLLIGLALWTGSESALANLVTQILGRLYTDKDPKDFRIILTPSPIPYISAQKVDLNEVRRSEEQAKLLKLAKIIYPVRDGMEIKISAGLFATIANVDELAGQIANVLARENPGIFGLKENPLFYHNQDIIKYINELIQSSNEAKVEREKLDANISAMGRLGAAGFSPWAIFEYEQRVYGWMADVFMSSANHSLARGIVRAGQYNLLDYARPIRLQILTKYIAILQDSDRGYPLYLKKTELTKGLKMVRLRMKLWAKPFFSGLAMQIPGLAVAGGLLISGQFMQQISFWALSAVHQTMDKIASLEISNHASEIGSLIKEKLTLPEMSMDFDFLSSVKEVFPYATYENALIVGSAVIVGYLAKKLLPSIAETARAALLFWEDSQRMRKKDISEPEEQKRVETFLAEEGAPEAAGPRSSQVNEKSRTNDRGNEKIVFKETIVILGSEEPTRAFRLGQNLSAAMILASAKLRNWGKSLGDTAAATPGALYDKGMAIGRGLHAVYRGGKAAGNGIVNGVQVGAYLSKLAFNASVEGSKKGAAYSKVKLAEIAEKGQRMSLALADAGGRRVAATWKKLGEVAKRTPGYLAEVTKETYGFTKAATPVVWNFGQKTVIYTAEGVVTIFIVGPAKGIRATFQGLEKVANGVAENLEKKWEKRAKRQLEEEQFQNEKQVAVEKYNQFLKSESTTSKDLMDALLTINEDRVYNGPGTYYPKVEVAGLNYEYLRPNRNQHYLDTLQAWITKARLEKLSNDEIISMIDMINRSEIKNKIGRTKPFLDTLNTLHALMNGPQRSIEKIRKIEQRVGFIRELSLRKAFHEAMESGDGKQNVELFLAPIESTLISGVIDTAILDANIESMLDYVNKEKSEFQRLDKFLGRLMGTISKDNEHTGFFKRMEIRQRFLDKAARFTPLEKIRWQQKYFATEFQKSSLGKGFAVDLKSGVDEAIQSWFKQANTVSDLVRIIDSDAEREGFSAAKLSDKFFELIINRPDLFVSHGDIMTYLEKDYFWPDAFADVEYSPLEKPLAQLLKEKRETFKNNPAWKYDPIVSERIHSFLLKRLQDLGQMPADFDGIFKIWQKLTERGVSTTTDELIAHLLKIGKPAQVSQLQIYAVDQGRVFDQAVQDEFALRSLKQSDAYKNLMAVAENIGTDRVELVRAVITEAQRFMKDMGITYINFLEEVAMAIHANQEEGRLLHEARIQRLADAAHSAKRNGEQAFDSRMKSFNDILKHVKKWSKKDQYDFLLYLRGEVDATPFIKGQFPKFGPERIRRMYQSLPLTAAMEVMTLYVRNTLLASKDLGGEEKNSIFRGRGKKLIKHLTENPKNPVAQEYAHELLEALLVGIEKSGNKPFQEQVLASLLAMKSKEDESIGQTMKIILEQFGAIGVKVGQFLVATNKLPSEINDILRETQDNARPPTLHQMYEDVQRIKGEGALGFIILKNIGSGSIKYGFHARDIKTQQELVMQVFRGDVKNNSELFINVLDGAIEHLINKRGGMKWAFLQVIVDGAVNAVRQEIEFEKESGKTGYAKKELYDRFSDSEFEVKVPQQMQGKTTPQLLSSVFAKGTHFKNLDVIDKNRVAFKILEMESEILWVDKDVIYYDPDRHGGNYLVHVRSDQEVAQGYKKYRISPIDFGQLTSITREQRNNVVELFALSNMLANGGYEEWVVGKIADLFKIPAEKRGKLAANIGAIFPRFPEKNIPGTYEVPAYFNLIAAINRSIAVKDEKTQVVTGKLDFAYADFVRAMIQLNQYEKADGVKLPPGTRSPRSILERRVKERMAEHYRVMEYSKRKEFLAKAKNSYEKFKSNITRKAPNLIILRPTLEQIDEFTMADKAGLVETMQTVIEEVTKKRDGDPLASHLLRCRGLMQ